MHVFELKFGKDLKVWYRVLNEIKSGRNTFDNSQFDINFGPIIINYKPVQTRINNLYDDLHKRVLNDFGTKCLD